MPIERLIKRRYGFGPTEVREALIAYLKDRDMPYPVSPEYNVSLTATGAVMEWTEEDEVS